MRYPTVPPGLSILVYANIQLAANEQLLKMTISDKLPIVVNIFTGEVMHNLSPFPRLVDVAGTLYPKKLWQHFAAICNIPHPSGHEAKLAEYVRKFATDLNLECKVDNVHNVIIRKPATHGMEKCKGVILQSHMDMVPSKTVSVTHDFTKDSINAVVDNGWVRATETSLGADNGIGVAAILSILEATDLKHGPLKPY